MDGSIDPLRIFLSYREDSSGHAGRLYDDLTRHFQGHQIFFDLDIEPGADFVVAIERAVGSCDVLLALIGRGWLKAVDDSGRSRLHDARDYVRLEVATALERNVLVVPTLVQGAAMPRAEDLPEALAPLTRRNAAELSDSRWSYDVQRLIRTLEKVPTAGLRPPGGQPGGFRPRGTLLPPVRQEPRPSVPPGARAPTGRSTSRTDAAPAPLPTRPRVSPRFMPILGVMALLLVAGTVALLAVRARTSPSGGSSAAPPITMTDSPATRTPSAAFTNQAATPPSRTPTPGPALPAEFDVLRAFSGRALVAPRGLKPFSDYPVSSVTYPFDRGTELLRGYQVTYGDRSAAHVSIAGFTGRGLFDHANSPDSFDPCASDAAYCRLFDIFRVDGQGNPTTEFFRGVSVGPSAALATHNICCGDVNSWEIVWFDATTNTAHEMIIVYTLPPADQYGGANLSESNVKSARTVADLGRQLVPAN